MGFWTDKGTCDEPTARFLQSLTDQKVFLFGTAGFGGAPAYFQQILDRVKANLAPGVQVTGTYMCQGKMPQAVPGPLCGHGGEPPAHRHAGNFDQALSHPDQEDLARLQAAVGE